MVGNCPSLQLNCRCPPFLVAQQLNMSSCILIFSCTAILQTGLYFLLCMCVKKIQGLTNKVNKSNNYFIFGPSVD